MDLLTFHTSIYGISISTCDTTCDTILTLLFRIRIHLCTQSESGDGKWNTQKVISTSVQIVEMVAGGCGFLSFFFASKESHSFWLKMGETIYLYILTQRRHDDTRSKKCDIIFVVPILCQRTNVDMQSLHAIVISRSFVNWKWPTVCWNDWTHFGQRSNHTNGKTIKTTTNHAIDNSCSFRVEACGRRIAGQVIRSRFFPFFFLFCVRWRRTLAKIRD